MVVIAVRMVRAAVRAVADHSPPPAAASQRDTPPKRRTQVGILTFSGALFDNLPLHYAVINCRRVCSPPHSNFRACAGASVELQPSARQAFVTF